MNIKFLYLINQQDSPYYKIGITKKNPILRLEELQIGNAEKLVFIDKFETKFSFKLERAIHQHFKFKRKNSEWFELDKTDVESFISICDLYEKNFDFLKKNSTLNKFI